jgi:hypothetical protein
MGIKFQEMMRRTRKITVEFQGESLEVEYRINVVTPLFLKQIGEQDERESLITQTTAAVERWELLDGEGKELPPDKEQASKLPTKFLQAVIQGIAADLRAPGDAEKKD